MEKESYGSPLMKKLVIEAQFLGVKVVANRDLIDGLWHVEDHNDEVHILPTAAAACWFVRGMQCAKSNLCSVQRYGHQAVASNYN